MSSSCQFQKFYKGVQIDVECCQNCYEHPNEKHQQSQYVQKINEIQAQLKRCWQHSQIKIRKNQKKPSPRINSFQITYRNLLVFSKLGYQKFPKPQNVATIIVGLINKGNQEIHRIRQILPKIGNNIDLYTHLSSKTKNLKFSLKFVVSELDKIIKYNDENQTIEVKNRNQQSNQENKQSIRENKIKKLISIKQTVKQNRKQNYSQFSSIDLASTYRNLRKTTRNSGFDSRMVDSQNANRLSAIKKEPAKYSYLSKQDDVFEFPGISQLASQQIQLLQLSEDENTCADVLQFNYETYANKQELRIKKIEEGLNFKLTSNLKQKKASRKYSFQYKKFAQLLEKQLKSDETLAKQLQTTQNKKSGFYEKSNQNNQNTQNQTSSEENAPSVYNLAINEFESKADVLRENQSMRQLEQKKYTLHQIESKEIDQNQCKEQEQKDQIKQADEQSVSKLQPQLEQSQKLIAIGYLQQNESAKSEQKAIIQHQQLSSHKGHYYDQKFTFHSIQGIVASQQIIQAILTPQCLPKEIIAQISRIVLYLNQINPRHFCSVLNTNDFQQIALLETPSFYKVLLFNTTKGLFQNYLFKLSVSNISIHSQVPSWVLVVSYCIFHLFYSKQSLQIQVQKLIRLLTGIPIVKVPAIDLRKVKKIIYQNNFQKQSEAKGRVLGVKANQQNIINFCQIRNFQKSKEFLNSIITFKKIDYKENQQTNQAKYEEFAIKYDFFLLWFQKENYFHNQFHSIFQKKQEEVHLIALTPNPTCKVIFSLSQASQIFVEYTQHAKTEKPNHILVCKFLQNNILQPVGELHKNGNFFFQLFLEAGQYALQISRCFDQKQANSIHFYSSNRLAIEKQQVSYTSLIQFTR